MKHVFFTIITLIISASISNAQILDTISKKQFIHYSFNDYKKIFKDESKALKIINRFNKNRIIEYYMYGATVLLIPTASIGPFPLVTLVVAGELTFRNTKLQLYDQLKTYEKYSCTKSTKPKFDSIFIENFSPQKTTDSLFAISFSEFKNIDYENIKSRYNVNDTTHLIFKLFESNDRTRDASFKGLVLFPILGVASFLGITSKGINEEETPVLIGIETFLSLGTVICFPIYANSLNFSKKEYLYHSLQNYFNHHTIDNRTKRYISNHIKNIKY